jgi:hypothetical protein
VKKALFVRLLRHVSGREIRFDNAPGCRAGTSAILDSSKCSAGCTQDRYRTQSAKYEAGSLTASLEMKASRIKRQAVCFQRAQDCSSMRVSGSNMICSWCVHRSKSAWDEFGWGKTAEDGETRTRHIRQKESSDSHWSLFVLHDSARFFFCRTVRVAAPPEAAFLISAFLPCTAYAASGMAKVNGRWDP